MTTTDSRTRIAVFIDFDNVEIGVKSTIGGPFDIGLVLEAIKERGEIVTKIAYSDWKRAGDYSRLLTQHAIRMVQRNVTPGGDKNGADITMALDALEMAFTHDHINAFVIVGGDSDFISLVEKLKQYGRKVIVVGGRQFTSATMQKNCHEFIAYENLVGTRGSRGADRRGRPAGTSDIASALPLVKRALKVLSEREVTPQLGLLKSTLLQLDSTFSEREYGAGSFRDFMEKVAEAGAVALRQAGRSMLVEARDVAAATARPTPPGKPADVEAEEEPAVASPMTPQDGIRVVQEAFGGAATPPRWPMYVRQAKQFLRNAIPGFDEKQYGFASVVDLLRAAGKEGVLRVERDRQGAVRIFAGPNLAERPAAAPDAEPIVAEPVAEPPIVDAEPMEQPAVEVVAEEPPKRPARRRRRTTPRSAGEPKATKPTRTRRASKPRAGLAT
ncbi:MAG: NYN domain-containing protein [Acidobacteria bacterium]|nr:NYN domain-containing protein [Acidobacteriota bacterium]